MRLGGGASLGGWSGARLTGAGLGRGEHGGASGPGVPSCALRARHCSWDCSFRGLLGPRRLASSEQSAGLWTTGKGTRTRRSREPCLLPFVCSLGADWNGDRRKASPLGPRVLPLHPFAYSSDPRAFPKQPSVLLPTGLERITGRKARGLQTEKINCKCQTFFSLS